MSDNHYLIYSTHHVHIFNIQSYRYAKGDFMRKHIKLILGTVAVSLIFSGCSTSKKDTIENTIDVNEPLITESTSKKELKSESDEDGEAVVSEPIFIQKFSALMNSHPDAKTIVAFMNSCLDKSAPDEADLALSRLIMAQEAISDDWTDMMIDGRLVGFQEMGYEWDRTQIDNITDPEMRTSYNELIQSYCRIKTYEEYPSVESDWKELQVFNSHLSGDVKLMLELNAKVQNYEYGINSVQFADIAKDILELETPLKQRQYDYMSFQMNKTYNRLIGEFFYGIEGMNMEYWNNSSSPLIQTVSDVVKNNPNTEFGKLCFKFLDISKQHASSDSYFNIVGDVLSNYNTFGLQSSLSLETKYKSFDNLKQSIELLKCPYNTNIEKRVNDAILEEVYTLRRELNWNKDSSPIINENSYSTFTNEKYYSTTLYSSTSMPDNNYISAQKHLTFDLKTGNLLSLSDLIDQPYDVYAPILLDKVKDRYMQDHTFFNDLESLPTEQTFELDEDGLILNFDKGEISPDHMRPFSVFIPHSDLITLYDPIKLYE